MIAIGVIVCVLLATRVLVALGQYGVLVKLANEAKRLVDATKPKGNG